jgi:hypothetical protein
LITTRDYVSGNDKPESYETMISKNIKPSWYNSYNLSEIEDCIRNTIKKMFKNKETTNVWGFKEIRYDGKNIKFIKHFKQLFPQTKIIIQIRENIVAQSNSGWYKRDRNAPKILQKTNKELYDFYQTNSSYCYFTTFEKMFDKNNVQNIFKFIGCSEHFDENKIKIVLANNLKD